MLGKRSCLLQATGSQSLLMPCVGGEGQPTTFEKNAQVIEENFRPALSAPCKVVIGFDLGTEKKATSDACESPRSVLDTLALLASQEKQHVVVARSPRSGLGSLLTATSGTGLGFKVVAEIQDVGVASYGPGIDGARNSCKNDHIHTWQGEAWSLCENKDTGTHVSPSKGQTFHHVSLDMECEDISHQQSIFSATSPPSCSHSLAASFSGFLKFCSFCGHSLQTGKDIFMYRGDQGFCSADCRYQKIVLDESKETQGK